jgi:hypothetical protein
MKFSVIPTIAAILLFIVGLGVTYKNEANVDGYTVIGFPLYFYKNTGGKLIDEAYRVDFGFNLKYLLIDLACLGITIFLFNVVYRRIKNRQKTNL